MPCDLVQQIKNLFSVSTAAERRRGDGGLIRSICQLWRVALRHVARVVMLVGVMMGVVTAAAWAGSEQAQPTPDLMAGSDTGLYNNDDVTAHRKFWLTGRLKVRPSKSVSQENGKIRIFVGEDRGWDKHFEWSNNDIDSYGGNWQSNTFHADPPSGKNELFWPGKGANPGDGALLGNGTQWTAEYSDLHSNVGDVDKVKAFVRLKRNNSSEWSHLITKSGDGVKPNWLPIHLDSRKPRLNRNPWLGARDHHAGTAELFVDVDMNSFGMDRGVYVNLLNDGGVCTLESDDLSLTDAYLRQDTGSDVNKAAAQYAKFHLTYSGYQIEGGEVETRSLWKLRLNYSGAEEGNVDCGPLRVISLSGVVTDYHIPTFVRDTTPPRVTDTSVTSGDWYGGRGSNDHVREASGRGNFTLGRLDPFRLTVWFNEPLAELDVEDFALDDDNRDSEITAIHHGDNHGENLNAYVLEITPGNLRDNRRDTISIELSADDLKDRYGNDLVDLEKDHIVVTYANQAPTLHYSPEYAIANGNPFVVDLHATDPEGDTEGDGLTYSLSKTGENPLAFEDNEHFTIDEDTGVLAFDFIPEFVPSPPDGVPIDANEPWNEYRVQVTVTDSWGKSSTAVDLRVIVNRQESNQPAVQDAPDLATESDTGPGSPWLPNPGDGTRFDNITKDLRPSFGGTVRLMSADARRVSRARVSFREEGSSAEPTPLAEINKAPGEFFANGDTWSITDADYTTDYTSDDPFESGKSYEIFFAVLKTKDDGTTVWGDLIHPLVVTFDTEAPTLTETVQIVELGNNTTPGLGISASEAGYISYSGVSNQDGTCFGEVSRVYADDAGETITNRIGHKGGFRTEFPDGTYNGQENEADKTCYLRFSDVAGNAVGGDSETYLYPTAFTIDTTPPSYVPRADVSIVSGLVEGGVRKINELTDDLVIRVQFNEVKLDKAPLPKMEMELGGDLGEVARFRSADFHDDNVTVDFNFDIEIPGTADLDYSDVEIKIPSYIDSLGQGDGDANFRDTELDLRVINYSPPEIEIEAQPTYAEGATELPIAFVFSEAIVESTFEYEDVVVDGGVITPEAWAAGTWNNDSTRFEVVVQPLLSTEETHSVWITVDEDAVQEQTEAALFNELATDAQIQRDTRRPNLTYVLIASENVSEPALVGAGSAVNEVTVSFRADEPLNPDGTYVLLNGSLRGLPATYDAEDDLWTASQDLPSGLPHDHVYTFRIHYEDLAGNGNDAITETIDSDTSVTVDRAPPTMEAFTPIGRPSNDSFEVTVTFDEPVKGFDQDSMTVPGDVAAIQWDTLRAEFDDHGFATSYTVDVTPLQ
ncbi:MAG: cadherin repeat domain-containing protein, partial [Hyphomicrobiales bacterium]|nr:cadherin repeat domain-containing protein [Hyphomicrobiales bacterium]